MIIQAGLTLIFVTTALIASEPVCSRSDVVFCYNFEKSDWRSDFDDYDNNPDGENTRMQDPGPLKIPGNNVMRLRAPEGVRGGGDLVKILGNTYDRLYARWYQKWEKGYNFNAGCHNGGLFAGTRNYLGQSNYRPNGDDFFVATLEPCGENRPHFYAYYRGMYMDCADPQGQCWGDHLPCMLDEGSNYCTKAEDRDQPGKLPPLIEDDRWYCFEIMVDAGTPVQSNSQADGILNFWVDGVEYGPFTNVWLRTNASLKLSILWLSLFNHDDTHSVEGIMVDDVVVATEKIGIRDDTQSIKSTNKAVAVPVSMSTKRIVPDGFTFIISHIPEGQYTLVMCDVYGRTLLNEHFTHPEAGPHTITYMPSVRKNESMDCPGIYFIRLKGNHVKIAQTLSVVR